MQKVLKLSLLISHLSLLSQTHPHILRNNPKRFRIGKNNHPVASAIVRPLLSCQHDRFLFIMCHTVATIAVHALSKLSGRSSASSYQTLFPPSTSSGLEILIVRNRPVQSYTSSNKNSYVIKKDCASDLSTGDS